LTSVNQSINQYTFNNRKPTWLESLKHKRTSKMAKMTKGFDNV